MKEVQEYVQGLSAEEIQSRIEGVVNVCNRLAPNEDSFTRVDKKYTISLKKYCRVLESELLRRG